jgi:hypothetical protein
VVLRANGVGLFALVVSSERCRQGYSLSLDAARDRGARASSFPSDDAATYAAWQGIEGLDLTLRSGQTSSMTSGTNLSIEERKDFAP